MKLLNTGAYLLLIQEEAEIKEGNIAIHDFGMGYDLEIPCDKDNLKSNTRKLVVAYYPLSKEAKELDLPLLPPFKKLIDIEKLACNIYNLSLDEYEYINEDLSQNRSLIEEHYKDINREEIAERYFDVISFIAGYNAAQSDKQFSLEDMKDILEEGLNWFGNGRDKEIKDSETWFNHYIKSLSTQQLPKEFIPEYDLMNEGYDKPEDYPYQECKVLKTITNSEGKEVVQGKWIY